MDYRKLFSITTVLVLALPTAGWSVMQPQQIPASPLPSKAGELKAPEILEEGVGWTTRLDGAVGYLWVAKVQNDNGVAVIATVTVRLHDVADQVIHEDTFKFVIPPGERTELSEEGKVPEDLAEKAGYWTFGASAQPFDAALADEGAEEPPLSPDPTISRLPPPLKILDVEVKPTEINLQSGWWRMAWQLTVENPTSDTIEFDGVVELLDFDGFVINDMDLRESAVLEGQIQTFTGYELIDSTVAPNVAGAKAKLRYDGREVDSIFDPMARFPIELSVYHRHFMTPQPGTLTLHEDRIEFVEFSTDGHRFSVPTANVTQFNSSTAAQLNEQYLVWTIHFRQDTPVGDKATINLDLMGFVDLIRFVDRFCPYVNIVGGCPTEICGSKSVPAPYWMPEQ